MSTGRDDVWAAGDAYEPYVGRWSRLVAQRFLAWLDMPPGKEWLDVGCGTGALTQTILEHAVPRTVTGVDASPGFIEYAQAHVTDARASFRVGRAESLPVDTASCDAVVSGLVLNFLPQPAAGVSEMTRTARPGAVVAAYLWDYAAGMEMIRQFWDAAAAVDPAAADVDEGRRFPLCRSDALAALFADAGLSDVEVREIDVPTRFRDFDDYWSPFLGGQGPAPGYAMSLGEAHRATLRERLRSQLPTSPDGSIRLTARAWAVRGFAPSPAAT
ncbi:MAG: class I SAM-dependent methyltransferase [Rhodospirillaceae bacterium]